ncbi:MAG: hypothetical protein JSS11_02590 [Verrucomicrobia bacterium]|nr:hypothetical protein [Verrucomicrobiota bacterium]
MMPPLVRHVRLIACLGLLPGLAAHAADGLAGDSPFKPPASAGAANAATPDALIELRGIMAEGDHYMFSIFDTGKKSSTWARLNEPGRDFVIKSHDEARDLITVEQNGRLLTLTLKQAKVVSGGNAVMPMPRPVAGTPPVPVGGPVVLNPTPADEQRRLEAVATEVRRRRALREQAAQQGSQAQR